MAPPLHIDLTPQLRELAADDGGPEVDHLQAFKVRSGVSSAAARVEATEHAVVVADPSAGGRKAVHTLMANASPVCHSVARSSRHEGVLAMRSPENEKSWLLHGAEDMVVGVGSGRRRAASLHARNRRMNNVAHARQGRGVRMGERSCQGQTLSVRSAAVRATGGTRLRHDP